MRTARALAVLCVASIAHAAPSTAVVVTGAVDAPATFAPADLARLPSRTVVVAGADGERRYTGAPIRDVVVATRPVEADRFALRRAYVVATGTDGYVAVFSWAELTNSPAGDDALVVYARNGEPLDDAEGALATIAAKDVRTGPRHVRWLRSLELRLVEPAR